MKALQMSVLRFTGQWSDKMQLNLNETLSSGQCFRAREVDGLWTVYSGVDENVRCLHVSQDNLSPVLNDDYWSGYFDMHTSYSDMKQYFSSLDPVLAKACAYAPGIRILNQDPWEALCSFVVSQNNNIKRIMNIVERMCAKFGKCGGFPCADTLAGASEQDLRECGLGFRAPYIINTATALCNGSINFDYLKKADINEARKILMQVKGIGIKVADCALLFGCHRLDCFPMDVWMKRVMALYFPSKDSSFFGPNAGVAQQYLFHWIRTSENNM